MTPEEFATICKDYCDSPEDHAWGEDHPIFKLANENDILKKNYNELIMTVERKWDGETRHETALRYIKQAEATTTVCAKDPL
jgi:hemerythrin-like domain-containing protein